MNVEMLWLNDSNASPSAPATKARREPNSTQRRPAHNRNGSSGNASDSGALPRTRASMRT